MIQKANKFSYRPQMTQMNNFMGGGVGDMERNTPSNERNNNNIKYFVIHAFSNFLVELKLEEWGSRIG